METKEVKKGKWIGLLSMIPVVQAGLTDEAGKAPGVAKGSIFDMAMKFINFAITAIGVLGVIMFIYAGFMYMTAAGDETRITKAKNAMTYAIVGIVVAMLGFVVVYTIDRMMR